MKFVILFHETPEGYERPSHWDLMWEEDDESPLTTFAVYGEPAIGGRLTAEKLAPHRREYLSYEGQVSGGRGTVSRLHVGEVEIVSRDEQCVELRLASPMFSCCATIAHTDDGWQVEFT